MKLLDWAHVPGWEKNDEAIRSLSELAIEENWGYRHNSSDAIDELGVLKSYLEYTFRRLQYEQYRMYTIARRKAEKKSF